MTKEGVPAVDGGAMGDEDRKPRAEVRCSDWLNCSDLSYCSGCSDCSYCSHCHNLKDSRWCILNVQLTEQEYKSKLSELMEGKETT